MYIKRFIAGNSFASEVTNACGRNNASEVVRDLARELYWRLGKSRPPFLASDYARLLNLPVTFRDIPAEGIQTDTKRLAMVATRREGDLTANIEGILHVDENDGCVVVLRRPQKSEPTCVKYRRNFTLAHEIGHFVIRRAIAGRISAELLRPNNPEEERLANLFASEILMPADRLVNSLRRSTLALHDFVMLSEQYEVSLQAFFVRLTRLFPNKFVFLMHRSSEHGPDLIWATPSTFKRLVLGPTARLTIERTLNIETAYGAVQHGVQEFILEGKNMRWSVEHLRLEESGLAVSCLRRTLRDCNWLQLSVSQTTQKAKMPVQSTFRFLDGPVAGEASIQIG